MIMDRPITVLVVDDEDFSRETVALYIESDKTLSLVGTCSDGASAVEAVRSLRPDVVLMDLRMPGVSGFAATRAIMKMAPGTKVLALTTLAADGAVGQFIECGGCGFVTKGSRAAKVTSAVHSAYEGNAVLPQPTISRALEHFKHDPRPVLTRRERKVVAAIADGQTNEEIARQLNVSHSTVKSEVTALIRKFRVTNRKEVPVAAQRFRLL